MPAQTHIDLWPSRHRINPATMTPPASAKPVDSQILALQALAHVAGNEDLGPRFLALTGLDAAGLRAAASDPALLAAVLEFLAAHEADLLRVAEALSVRPAALAAAARQLAGPHWE